MIAFRCACCTPSHTRANSSSLSRKVSLCRSQYSVMAIPGTYSITKYGRPSAVEPASNTLAIAGWSISASACRSAVNRATTSRVSIPARITFSATRRRTGSFCSAIHTSPMPPSPASCSRWYGPTTAPADVAPATVSVVGSCLSCSILVTQIFAWVGGHHIRLLSAVPLAVKPEPFYPPRRADVFARTPPAPDHPRRGGRANSQLWADYAPLGQRADLGRQPIPVANTLSSNNRTNPVTRPFTAGAQTGGSEERLAA